MDVLLTCALLAQTWPHDPAMGAPDLDEDACVVADLDLAGRLQVTTPDPGIAVQAPLSRGRAELGVVTRQGVSGRIALDVRRSAPEAGYLGLEGESLYMRAQIVEAGWSYRPLGLTFRGGLIDDPWVIRGNDAFTYRPLLMIQAERQLWMDRSDLGGSVTWVAPDRWVSVTVSILTGEGLQRRERNAGKNANLLVAVRPLAKTDTPDALVVELFGREGSRGPLSARDHRLGARVSGLAGPAAYGASFLKTWGVKGNTDRAPWGTAAWGTFDQGVFTSVLRVELVDQAPGTAEANDLTLLAAAGLRPPSERGRPAHFVLGVQHQAIGAQAAPIAGTDGAANITTVFAQLGVNLRAAAPITVPE